jgi:hypothetical protein
VRLAAKRALVSLAASVRGASLRDLLWHFPAVDTWQRRAAPWILSLPVANERLDDLQSGACFALGTPAFEVCRQLAVRAKNLLIADSLFDRALLSAAPSLFSHDFITRKAA